MVKKKVSMGKVLRRLGFDRSEYIRSTGYWHIGCSQCEAICINGVPCHERGCPNQRRNDAKSKDEIA